MKIHLIKYVGSADVDYFTRTYCGKHSEEWSEEFDDNLPFNLAETRNATTCKNCLKAYDKALNQKKK